jgi:acetoin utilization protein AcuB
MLVRYFMTQSVRTLDSTMSCAAAWQQFQREGLRRAPVMHDSKVLGLITDRDLIRILPRTVADVEGLASIDALDKTVGQCVKRTLISVAPNDHLETAAKKLLDNKVGGLPVVQDGQLKGIITESDLFRVFVKLKRSSKATRLTLHIASETVEPPSPARIAVATGVELHEFFSHASPSGGDLIDLRVAGKGIDEFVTRLLSAGYLLIDRADPEDVERER